MNEKDNYSNQKYSDFKMLHSSSKSCVVRALNEHCTPVLLKSFKKDPENIDLFVEDPFYNRIVPKELFYLMRLSGNSYVPQLLNYHENNEWSTVVMEYLGDDWMDLFDYLTSNDSGERIIKRIVKNVIEAMYEMCSRGYYHLDIKPENIMINSKTLVIKFIDFEDMLYSESQYPMSQAYVGTIGYKSPESFDYNWYDVKQSLVFNIGCLAYTGLENDMAFTSDKQTKICRPLEMRVSRKLASSFIGRCTKRNFKDRINFHKLLNDEWFSY